MCRIATVAAALAVFLANVGHRPARADEPQWGEIDTTATNELMMRNQYRAWVEFMAAEAA